MKHKIRLLVTTILSMVLILAGCRVEITALYDAVILGSGVSSVALALDLNARGKRVLIVEPSGIIGGNKRLISDGVSYLNIANGDNPEKFLGDIRNNNSGVTNFFTNTMIAESTKIPEWLARYNIQLDTTIRLPGHQLARAKVSENGEHTGKEVITKLDAALKASSVAVNYNSNITRITQEASDIYHITIEQKNTVVSVNAKTVIFGEDNQVAYDAVSPILNPEQLKATDFAGQLPMSPGMELLHTLQADYSNAGNLNFIDTYNMASSRPISPILRSYGAMLINQEGNRFVNEMGNTPHIVDAILKQTDQTAYIIYDEVINKQLLFLNDYYQNNTFFETSSITLMSHNLGVQEDVLRATLANYHKMIKENNDTQFQRPFNVDPSTFESITRGDGKYYAIKVRPVSTVFTTYAEITNRFEVMKNGQAMPGIYAIGDSAKDVRLNAMLSGTELTLQLTMGYVASDSVLAYLDKIDENKN